MSETVRQEIERLLREAPRTALDLSKLVGISERDVPEHLSHIARSLRRREGQLRVEPVRCLACDFVFRERERYSRPGRCPECHGRRLTLPRFWID
jgi:predicted Zn-ribbon and HTH transcriptional regulator